MLINKKRIRNPDRYLSHIPKGTAVRFGVRLAGVTRERLETIGARQPPEPGDTFLPASAGPVSRFNANGREVPRRDLPKETVYRQVEWSWTEWHGRDSVERTDVADVPYQRYPRDFIPPPSVELQVTSDEDGTAYLAVEAIHYTHANADHLRHNINLLLELFGECEVLREDLSPLVRVPVRRLNWEILPAGELPWDRLWPSLEPIMEKLKPRKRLPVRKHLDAIRRYGPKFCAVGNGGFSGYLVFGFEDLGLYVFESVWYGNATYVVERDWQRLSQLTKAEILDEDLHKARIVHRTESWEREIHALLDSTSAQAA